MSDYLSNLVARNLGWANTVHPRGRSLFEPPAEGGGTVWASPQLGEVVQIESIPPSRLDKQGSRRRENIAHPSSLANPSTSTPTPTPPVRGEQLSPPMGIFSDLAHDSVLQETVLEPMATPANPPQLQRQINTSTPPSSSATELSFTGTAQPNPAGLRQQGKQGSRGRETSTEPNSMATQLRESQPRIPFSPAPEPSTFSPANTTEKRDVIVPEPPTISPHLAQPLPLQPTEERGSVELVGEDVPAQSPPSNIRLREVNTLNNRGAEERGNTSIYPNDIESLPPKIQQTDSQPLSPSSSVPKPSTLPPITVTENRGKELIEEPSWELTSNSPQPESAVNNGQAPEAESQPARQFAKVAQPQVTSLVAKARTPSVTAGEQPTIQVTIGRIEVQAIGESQPWENLPPETPPVPPQPATPRLSLEEYLKSRQGGRR